MTKDKMASDINLRDFFASQAMQALMKSIGHNLYEYNEEYRKYSDTGENIIAKRAYDMADEMLKIRNKNNAP
jgi:hypothetical protein